MAINFDIIIETPEHTVDMKSALETLKGISDTTRCIADTVLTGRVIKKQYHTNNVRTSLKENFKGSYGQVFSIDIYDPVLEAKFKSIGKPCFTEVITYFISESLFLESKELTPKAQKIINNLGEKSEELVEHLRASSLESIHEISTKFNHDIKFRYRKSRNKQVVLGSFNRTTARTLQATLEDVEEDIVVSITRLNIYTGNGRLQLKGTDETIAFGFNLKYKAVKVEAKKIFSTNLNDNNGLNEDKWKYLRLSASPMKLRGGKVVKYIIKGFYEN
ncbi:hypothetical protein Q4601_14385 [Shewanella sp. 1_MG-2023]|uniref:DUF7946 domain-containing protein n=1 Tax=unclassified Shewanella TaxID=196818 RepID=UPI0026E16610|nr:MULTISPECIES: hypothetical protein [unclassified Shewanella]MDO6611397.1 hypothetical protein [Shewanella sp. 7_MG-2023]MDO6771252.1 hypothetical protein [Shewanella sp. 2_MG-2023]MDO6795493.1 hypothetical protein [Shewanella sp. 1_MG-2023]